MLLVVRARAGLPVCFGASATPSQELNTTKGSGEQRHEQLKVQIDIDRCIERLAN